MPPALTGFPSAEQDITGKFLNNLLQGMKKLRDEIGQIRSYHWVQKGTGLLIHWTFCPLSPEAGSP